MVYYFFPISLLLLLLSAKPPFPNQMVSCQNQWGSEDQLPSKYFQMPLTVERATRNHVKWCLEDSKCSLIVPVGRPSSFLHVDHPRLPPHTHRGCGYSVGVLESQASLSGAVLSLHKLLFRGRKRQAAKGLGFPLAKEGWASKPQAELLAGGKTKKLVCSQRASTTLSPRNSTCQRFRRLIWPHHVLSHSAWVVTLPNRWFEFVKKSRGFHTTEAIPMCIKAFCILLGRQPQREALPHVWPHLLLSYSHIECPVTPDPQIECPVTPMGMPKGMSNVNPCVGSKTPMPAQAMSIDSRP